MEVAGKVSSHGESCDKADRFYEQALLLVDCCKIPEAIKLLEKAIQLKPDSEIYKETLAFFQVNTQYYSDHLKKEQQGLSYASVARSKSSLGNGKEKSSFTDWNVKKAKGKDNPSVNTNYWSPAASSSYYSDTYEQATIDNPWASFVNRDSKRKKTHRSPIDGLSEIDLPQMNGDELNYTPESPSSKQDYEHQLLGDVDSAFSSTLKTPISSQEAMNEDGRSSHHERKNHSDLSADHFGYKLNGEYPDSFYTHIDNHDENLDTRFLEELCMAREAAIDDWAKYYDMLRNGIKEEAPCTPSDVLHQNIPTTREHFDSLDEIEEMQNVQSRNHLGSDQSNSDRPASKCSDKVCTKCGHLKESGNPSSNPTKNRIHFVNGACVSSSSLSNCTCNKQNKGNSEGQSSKSPLSSSQQEFYRNLQYYFGTGKVKSKKAATDTEKESSLKTSSDDLHPNSTTACNSHHANVSSTSSKELPKVRSDQNVTESRDCTSTKGGKQNDNKSSKEHFSCDVNGDGTTSFDPKATKSSFNSNGVKKDKKSFGEERCQQTSYKPKPRVDDKAKSKTKASVKTEHVKSSSSKEEATQRVHSHRQPRGAKVGVKSRVSHKAKAEDTIKPMPASDAKEKLPSHKHKTERAAQAEIDFSNLLSNLYCTGVSVLSKCGQALKSILYYVLVLVVLIVGFFIYCVWFAGCWLCKKVLHYVAVNRWLAHVRNKVSEWRRKRREGQKMSTEGQTYDLPKNGDAAVMHMLQNKDNDPYSVLGVPRDATDDDIRKQYRKLAVLIHPDKNTHPQADEAFKTLANAFDILSDPEKRYNYDAEAAWKRQADEREGQFGHAASPEQFFADLGRKMQEMQNYLHCNSCDGKHRRYSTDRFVLTARFCSRCHTRHAAKEGDLWAESSFLGYKLHFYACMEGEVFDVTEWAACQGIGSYHVEPDPHTVHLKLKTRQTHPTPSGFNSRSEEKDFENFMRAFFGQFPSEEERFQGTNKPRKRRRKKKH